MVSVCAGCNGFQPWAAGVVACLAAFLYLILSRLILYMGVDDPVDAVAIHAGGGIWGVIAAPIFMDGGKTKRPCCFCPLKKVLTCLHLTTGSWLTAKS